MQRLYSSFARGWPGMGLLVLRVTAAITAFHFSGSALSLSRSSMAVIEGALALLLCAGLWTPIAGSMLAGLAVWAVFSRNRRSLGPNPAGRSGRCARSSTSEALRPSSLRITQSSIVASIARAGAANPRQLGDKIAIDVAAQPRHPVASEPGHPVAPLGRLQEDLDACERGPRWRARPGSRPWRPQGQGGDGAAKEVADVDEVITGPGATPRGRFFRLESPLRFAGLTTSATKVRPSRFR